MSVRCRRVLVVVVAVAGLLISAVPVSHAASERSVGPLRGVQSSGSDFVDEHGRTVILRGVNVMDKWRGLGDEDLVPDIDEEDARRIAAMGFNSVRLGTTWDALEHEQDVFDDVFLEEFRATIDLLWAEGLTVVVDMHQDKWSEGVGSNGAPPWTDPSCNEVPSLPPEAKVDGVWNHSLDNFDTDSQAAWYNFWHDGYGELDPHCTGPLQQEFVDMWRHLASGVGDHPAVIGYDLLNEPWPALPPGAFETAQLLPLYERVSAAIRSVDADGIVFFEPPISHSAMVPSAFPEAPVDNSAYAPHVYTETMFTSGEMSTGAATDEAVMLADVHEAQRLGVPVWIGEWGAFENDASRDYQEQMYRLFDEYQLSAAYWLYAQGTSTGLIGEDAGAEVGHVRVWPEAFAGRATWRWRPDSAEFSMTWTVGPGTHTARVVVPERLGLQLSGRGEIRRVPGRQRALWSVQGPGTFELTGR